MLPTTSEHNEKNKENFQYISSKQLNDDDAESSHSDDCLIIEPEISLSTLDESNSYLLSMDVVPNYLPKNTPLLIIYEDRVTNVHLNTSVNNIENLDRITISHLVCLYSIPTRHLYLAKSCNIDHIAIAHQTRIMHISSLTNKYSLGYICETPSIYNHLRHLILFDDGTTTYTKSNDKIHLCLCQNFEQTSRSITTKLIRDNIEKLLFNKNLNKNHFQIHNYIAVKKFDDKYHNAQIIDIDCSIIKLKFYERQAQTEVWIHQQSSLINDTIMSPIEIASPIILQNKRKHNEISTDSRPSTPSSTRSFPTSYLPHKCSFDCVLIAEENFDPSFITQNPFTLPFSCGWKYFQLERYAKGSFTKKPSTHKTLTSRSNYLYRSPCGRSFLTLDEVEDYLLETNSKLTIKFFIDDRSTHLQSSIEYDLKYILSQDITQGKEDVQIPIYNDINKNYPERFLYGTEIRSKLLLPKDTTELTCCSCTDNCRNRLKCACWLKTFEQAKLCENYQILSWQRQNLSDEQMILRFGYTHQRLKTSIWSGIYECNSNCSCHTRHCTNRLVQNSLYQQLQLFYTDIKGWGIRALHDIPYGSFINAYVGELITEEMATKRDFKYLAILDHKSHINTTVDNKKQKQPMKKSLNNVKMIVNEQTPIPIKRCVRISTDSQSDDGEDDNDDSCFILDAKHYGSISRFYNHSCKPNVQIQNVFINSHDPRFPVIALFACRPIRAGEEICWDYNYTVGCMPGVHIDCKCQASNCRGRLL